MTREEAQYILRAYRPSGEDAQDPQFQGALEMARHDPGLGRWFLEEQALDRALSAKIRSGSTPADLKMQLLLARTTIRPAPWWRRRGWMALAAGLILVVVISGSVLQHFSRRDALKDFQAAMAGTSLDMTNHMDVMGLDVAGYKSWLAEHRGDPDFVLPPGVAGKEIAACKVFEWRGARVTMLCCKPGGRHVDVFVINASELPRLRLKESPAYAHVGDVTTVAWKRGSKLYLLAGAMSAEALKQFL